MAHDNNPKLRNVQPEPLGPAPTAGPYINQRFRREGNVSTDPSSPGGTRPPGPTDANDWRPIPNAPRLRRGREVWPPEDDGSDSSAPLSRAS
jgi:hypothetical protein